MTKGENERLAVVETKIDDIDMRVQRIETKVDGLVRRDAARSGMADLVQRVAPWGALVVAIVAMFAR